MMNNKTVFFDHFEIHVADVPRYCEFLVRLFGGGRYKVLDDSCTSMFMSNEGICIEIKKRAVPDLPTASGVCHPCLRMKNAREFIEKELGLKIERSTINPDGDCHFFTDHENVKWHIKDYLVRDKFVNW